MRVLYNCFTLDGRQENISTFHLLEKISRAGVSGGFDVFSGTSVQSMLM